MSLKIQKGLQLPAFDLQCLNEGKIILAPFKFYLSNPQPFWLYPTHAPPCGLTWEEYYKPEYVAAAQASAQACQAVPLDLTTWAFAGPTWIVFDHEKTEVLDYLSESFLWNRAGLERVWERFQGRWLFFRVFRLQDPTIVHSLAKPETFYWPSNDDRVAHRSDQDPAVLSLDQFSQCREHILKARLEITTYQKYIDYFTKHSGQDASLHNETTWISTITNLGHRTTEQEETFSNYEAGTLFEEIVRRSLRYLGFQVDEEHHGGAGGVDLFCSYPYFLIGECKSGKKIPNDTAVQLLNLGTLRLSNQYQKAVKLIIGPGQPTKQLYEATKAHKITIMSPETLEQLVKLHSQYPIDLWKLKQIFDSIEDGKDTPMLSFIAKTRETIRIRADLIQLIKDTLKKTSESSVSLKEIKAIYRYTRQSDCVLDEDQLKEILIELSSPLLGYLGREGEHFYYLRDLVMDEA